MTTYRDGGGFSEAEGASDESTDAQAPPATKKGFNFRTGDELPIGRLPVRAPVFKGDDPAWARAAPGGAAPSLDQVFVPASVAGALSLHSLTLQGNGDLVAASRVLRQAGVKAWVTVASSDGPVNVDLVQFLRLRGLE